MADDNSNNDASHLLRLPGEIRVRIYEHVFIPYTIAIEIAVSNSGIRSSHLAYNYPVSIFLVCRKIHAEVRTRIPEAIVAMTGPMQHFSIAPRITVTRLTLPVYCFSKTKQLNINCNVLPSFRLGLLHHTMPLLETITFHAGLKISSVYGVREDGLRCKRNEIPNAECGSELMTAPLYCETRPDMYECQKESFQDLESYLESNASHVQVFWKQLFVGMDDSSTCRFVLVRSCIPVI